MRLIFFPFFFLILALSFPSLGDIGVDEGMSLLSYRMELPSKVINVRRDAKQSAAPVEDFFYKPGSKVSYLFILADELKIAELLKNRNVPLEIPRKRFKQLLAGNERKLEFCDRVKMNLENRQKNTWVVDSKQLLGEFGITDPNLKNRTVANFLAGVYLLLLSSDSAWHATLITFKIDS